MSKGRKTIQTIQDPLLEPFFISKDDYCFTVKEMVTSNPDHFRSNNESKTYEKALYFFPTFEMALSKIAELKTEFKDYATLESYIEDYTLIKNQIKKYTDGVRSTI